MPDAVRQRQGSDETGFARDASLGGRYPVMNVTLLHPKDQGCFPSFGAHPRSLPRLARPGDRQYGKTTRQAAQRGGSITVKQRRRILHIEVKTFNL